MPENLPDAEISTALLLHGVFMLTSSLPEISIFGIFSSFFLLFVVQYVLKTVSDTYFDIFERFQMVSHENKGHTLSKFQP